MGRTALTILLLWYIGDCRCERLLRIGPTVRHGGDGALGPLSAYRVLKHCRVACIHESSGEALAEGRVLEVAGGLCAGGGGALVPLDGVAAPFEHFAVADPRVLSTRMLE